MTHEAHDPRHNVEAAHAAMQATQRVPYVLTRDEGIKFLTSMPYMGAPEVIEKEPGTPGPKFKKTQYHRAVERRRDLYRRLVKLPDQGKARLSWFEAQPWYIATLKAVLNDKSVPARGRAKEVCNRLSRRGREQPWERTVRAHLAKIIKKGASVE